MFMNLPCIHKLLFGLYIPHFFQFQGHFEQFYIVQKSNDKVRQGICLSDCFHCFQILLLILSKF